MQRILVITSACVVLIASGVVHGVWTDRWSDQSDLVATAGRLERLPMTIGAWHGSVVEMERDPNTSLAGMVVRRYVNSTDGKAVTILLACGRAGAVCTHTPEVCYAASGYEVEKPKRFAVQPNSGKNSSEFWNARFVKERASGKTHLRIFWAWHGAESWKIADYPRVAFAGEKVLYKLYLIREMVQPDEPLEGDACVEFMQELLPAFRNHVFAEAK